MSHCIIFLIIKKHAYYLFIYFPIGSRTSQSLEEPTDIYDIENSIFICAIPGIFNLTTDLDKYQNISDQFQGENLPIEYTYSFSFIN